MSLRGGRRPTKQSHVTNKQEIATLPLVARNDIIATKNPGMGTGACLLKSYRYLHPLRRGVRLQSYQIVKVLGRERPRCSGQSHLNGNGNEVKLAI
jgi:hypothetical protein